MNINEFKNKILYRATHRGNKEMDLLLGNFVKQIIKNIDKKSLILLEKLVNFDDEMLLKINENKVSIGMHENNKIIELFKNYKLKK